MNAKENRFTGWLKKSFRTTLIGMRQVAGTTREKIALDKLFRKNAVKLTRITTSLVNLVPSLWGVFDRKASTLTVRVAEKLEIGELFESEHVQYRIEVIRPDQIAFPMTRGGKIESLPCFVAELKTIGQRA